MRFTLIEMAFERPWLTAERVGRIQTAFEWVPPRRGGDGDPLARYRPGMILQLYEAGSGFIFLDGPVTTTTGVIEETHGHRGVVRTPGRVELHLHSDDLQAHRELGTLARWLGSLPELVLGSWFDLHIEQAVDDFIERGVRSSKRLNSVGLPLLSTHTFFGAQLVDRIGVATLRELHAEPYGGHGGAYVHVDPGHLSGAELVLVQKHRSRPLVDAGLVAENPAREGISGPGPAWTPLQFSVERVDES